MTLIPRRDDAEEVLQSAAATLWRKFGEYDSERDFLPWALRVTYFEILNFRKQAARSRLVFREDVLQLVAETQQSESQMLELQREALRECLKLLDSEGRTLLRRRYGDSLAIATLADEVGTTAKSIYRRLDRLRDRLAECVQRRLLNETV